MARIRTIKPEFWDDEKMANVSDLARLFYIGIWNFSDDYGVVKGNTTWLKNQVFPYDKRPVDVFESAVEELINSFRLVSFSKNGESYYFIPKFKKHQNINRPSRLVKNPDPPEDIMSKITTLTERSLSTHATLSAVSVREGNSILDNTSNIIDHNNNINTSYIIIPHQREIQNLFEQTDFKNENEILKLLKTIVGKSYSDTQGNEIKKLIKKLDIEIIKSIIEISIKMNHVNSYNWFITAFSNPKTKISFHPLMDGPVFIHKCTKGGGEIRMNKKGQFKCLDCHEQWKDEKEFQQKTGYKLLDQKELDTLEQKQIEAAYGNFNK